jgi:hypothetical protein
MNFLRNIFFIILFSFAHSFEPPCSLCKFYIPHNSNPDLSLCKLFGEKTINEETIIKNFASHCRNNENLCGSSGFLFEPYVFNDTTIYNKQADELYNRLDNMCCGEVNEKLEIEEYDNMEKELFNILQKIKKHNVRRVYKTSRELYKLFKTKK